MEKKDNRDPFIIPEGYLDSLEVKVHEKIKASEGESFSPFAKFKPALMLAVMFGVIAGIGYLVTEATLKLDASVAEHDGIIALIEEGYISSSFIDSYYSEMDVEELFINSLENTPEIGVTVQEELEMSMDRNEILDYLSTEDE